MTSLNGSVTIAQQDYLRILCSGMTNVAETGFNQGWSAMAMLSANPVIRAWSFELADHDAIHAAKLQVDQMFPGRHRLIGGDSRVMMKTRWADMLWDMVFVDGGHDYATVAQDLENGMRWLRPHGLLVCDDLTPWKPWGKGPAQAWADLLASGKVVMVDLRLDGQRIMTVPEDGPDDARVWATGMVM